MAWKNWILFLLFGCVTLHVPGKVSVIDNGMVNVTVGDNVTLPCYLQKNFKDILYIYWQRSKLQVASSKNDDVLMFYGEGKPLLEHQHVNYRNRVSILPNKLHDGNFSVMLSSVQTWDIGEYNTIVLYGNDQKLTCKIWLNVGVPFSKPEITVGTCNRSTRSLRVRCESREGFPSPIIHWTLGKEPVNSEQVQTQITSINGTFSVLSQLELPAPEGVMITCTVENPTLLTKENSSVTICNIPEDRPKLFHGLWLLGLFGLIFFLAAIVYVFCFKKTDCCLFPVLDHVCTSTEEHGGTESIHESERLQADTNVDSNVSPND